MLVVSLMVILACAAILNVIRRQDNALIQKQPTTPSQPSVSTANHVDSMKSQGNQFFDVAKKIDQDLHFFKDPNAYFSCPAPACFKVKMDSITYYQIGVTQGGQRILVVRVPTDGPSANEEYVAIEKQLSQFDILAKLNYTFSYKMLHDPQAFKGLQDSFKMALDVNVSLNTTDIISELAFKDTVSVNGLDLKLSTLTGYSLTDGLNGIRGVTHVAKTPSLLKKIADVDGRTFYEVTVQDSSNFKIMEIYAVVGGVYTAEYKLANPLNTSGSNPIQVNWIAGDQNKSNYVNPTMGCGSADGYAVTKNLQQDQLTLVGNVAGKNLYLLPDSSALLQELYKAYIGFKDSISDKTLGNLSVEQFQNAHAVVVSSNAYGELEIYERSDIFYIGGCGKPVIYLYPQQTTTVDVQVGADVKKSDPLYTPNGWQQVRAEASGQLTYQGRPYSSLYWEGFGRGPYPSIISGSVVRTKDTAAVIRHQLVEQGLKSNEINDFMDFWQPKLPTTPYVRLSWLSTAEMNNLAPLDINPKPNTLIRVFLDFEGLDQPIRISPQRLNAPVRQGFTVVEWGGLLRDGSIKR